MFENVPENSNFSKLHNFAGLTLLCHRIGMIHDNACVLRKKKWNVMKGMLKSHISCVRRSAFLCLGRSSASIRPPWNKKFKKLANAQESDDNFGDYFLISVLYCPEHNEFCYPTLHDFLFLFLLCCVWAFAARPQSQSYEKCCIYSRFDRWEFSNALCC